MSLSFNELGDIFKAKEAQMRLNLDSGRISIFRCDGWHFHTFTRAFLRPYDPFLHYALESSLLRVLQHDLKGFWALVYFQSDEASVVIPDIEREDVNLPFDGRVEKIFGVLLQWGIYFDRALTQMYGNQLTTVDVDALKPIYKATNQIHQLCGLGDIHINEYLGKIQSWMPNHVPSFDCRTLQLDTKDEVTQYLEWRRKDAIRNAKNSLARMFLSPKQMINLSANEVVDRIETDYGVDYERLPSIIKRGSIYHSEKFADWVNDGFNPTDEDSGRFQTSVEKQAVIPSTEVIWSTRDAYQEVEDEDISI